MIKEQAAYLIQTGVTVLAMQFYVHPLELVHPSFLVT